MTRQGSCQNSTPDALAVVDRLAGLSKVISPAVIEQALLDTGRAEQRACRLSHRVTLWIVLAMGVLTDLPIRQVFKHARRMRPEDKTPSRSNLCEARQRLAVEPVRRVFDLVVKPLATPQTLGGFYHDLRLMGIDGTVLDVPDTPANERILAGAVVAVATAPSRKSARSAWWNWVRMSKLPWPLAATTTANKNWPSNSGTTFRPTPCWWKIAAFSATHTGKNWTRGTKLLARLKGNLILRPIQRLPDGSFLAKIYPSPRDRDRDRDGIVVRVIEYTLNDPERTGHGETHRLATNLFDHTRFPAFELACYYHERWEEELVFDEQKTHQDPRRPSKPTHLRSQTPAGVEQELYALSLGHFVVRALMLEAAQQESLDVDRLSFTGCLQILQARLPECDSIDPQGLNRWYRLLLAEMAQHWSHAATESTPAWSNARCPSSPRNVRNIDAERP